MKLLKAALDKQDYTLAAHVLVYGMIKAQVVPAAEAKRPALRNKCGCKNKQIGNGKKRRPKGQPERS